MRSRPDQARGPHAALAGDELVAVEGLGDEHRLEHAVLADACRELLEHRVVDPVARLVRVRRDARERHLHDRRRRGRALRDQRGQAAAERRGVPIGPDRHAPIPASWVDGPAIGRAAPDPCRSPIGRARCRRRGSAGVRGPRSRGRDRPRRPSTRAGTARSARRGWGPPTAGRCVGRRSRTRPRAGAA